MKDIKRFFVGVVCVLALFCVIDVLASFVLPKMNSYFVCRYPESNASKMSFVAEKTTADILIIGASTASHHYIPSMIEDSIGMTCFNSGWDGTFLQFQGPYIQLISDRYIPKYILWEYYEDMLSYDLTDRNMDYQNVFQLRKYISNPACEKICVSEGTFERVKLLSSIYRYNNTLPDYIYSSLASRKIDRGYVPIDEPQSSFPTFRSSMVKESINEEKVALFDETLRYCRDKGVKIIFTSSPRYQNADIKSTMQYKKYRSMIAEYGFPIIDCYNNEPFNSDSTLFKDGQHMNSKGAELYMTQFIPELKKVMAGYDSISAELMKKGYKN